ncbi:hypothetical protein FRB94_009510 [Tulasnella sp. JGI-2019a]|nr:hypothetical protein FRB94_009510 [Tulasnella sp. JGI-2019a]KAG9003141.1 hypothetical protein FRB93_011221 [Tulasnella sp. JGI-2019a]
MSMSGSTQLSLSYYAEPPPGTGPKVFPTNPRPIRHIIPPKSSGNQNIPPQLLAKIDLRLHQFNDLYTRTTHIVPSASPRTLAKGALANLNVPPGEDAAARKIRVQKIGVEILEKKKMHERGEKIAGVNEMAVQPQLFNVLDRYTLSDSLSQKESGRTGLTLFLAHANGFLRRIWEPTLRHLLSTQSDNGYFIEEVWSFEAVNHGDSAVLNFGKLGEWFEWIDSSRDILNFIQYHLPDRAGQSDLPTFLQPVTEAEALRRTRDGFMHRTIVGMGHSLGGCTTARAVAESPALWSSLILVDPVIVPIQAAGWTASIDYLVNGAVARRNDWASREEALGQFLKTPFFQRWDREALDVYVNEGIIAQEGGGVTLKMPGLLEGISFAERGLVSDMWTLLDTIDERIPLRWVMSGEPPIVTGPEELTAHTLWRRSKNASNIRIQGASHLIVQEAPNALAEDVSSYFSKQYGAASEHRLGPSRL